MLDTLTPLSDALKIRMCEAVSNVLIELYEYYSVEVALQEVAENNFLNDIFWDLLYEDYPDVAPILERVPEQLRRPITERSQHV